MLPLTVKDLARKLPFCGTVTLALYSKVGLPSFVPSFPDKMENRMVWLPTALLVASRAAFIPPCLDRITRKS